MFTTQREKNPNQKLHVTLYFDLNGTIMAGDAANGKSMEDSIWQMICENTKGKWDLEQKKEMTFREYIEEVLYPGDNKDQTLKRTRHAQYKNFYSFLIENKHSLANEVKEQFNLLREKMNKGVLFESFIDFIKYLKENNSQYTYTIALRTFGDDLQTVIDELERRAELKIDGSAEFSHGNLNIKNGPVLKTIKSIDEWINKQSVCAIRDDWKYWHENNETWYFGKLFPFAKNTDINRLEIFFDDNVKKQIITAQALYGETVTQDIQSTLMKRGQIVSVDTYLAAKDENYFIKHFEVALQERFRNIEMIKNQHQKQIVLYRNFR